MFKKKYYRRWEAFGYSGSIEAYSKEDSLALALEKASALQEQNRRDYNLLFERQNLILNHLKLRYVPEKSVTEPAKLEEKLVVTSCNVNKVIGDLIREIEQMEPPKRKYVKSGKKKMIKSLRNK